MAVNETAGTPLGRLEPLAVSAGGGSSSIAADRRLLLLVQASFQGKAALCSLLLSDGSVELGAFVRFLNRHVPEPVSADFVARMIGEECDAPTSTAHASRAQVQALLFPRAAARDAAATVVGAAGDGDGTLRRLPPLAASASLPAIHQRMTEQRAELVRSKARLRRRRRLDDSRQHRRGALTRNAYVWHPRAFDASGDNGNLCDARGRKAARAWHIVPPDPEPSPVARVAQRGPYARVPPPVGAAPPAGALTWSSWARGTDFRAPPLEMFPERTVLHIRGELQRAVAFARAELRRHATEPGATQALIAVESQCKKDLHHMQGVLARIDAECVRRERVTRAKARARQGPRAAAAAGGGSGSALAAAALPPLMTASAGIGDAALVDVSVHLGGMSGVPQAAEPEQVAEAGQGAGSS
eukprot:g5189.t1